MRVSQQNRRKLEVLFDQAQDELKEYDRKKEEFFKKSQELLKVIDSNLEEEPSAQTKPSPKPSARQGQSYALEAKNLKAIQGSPESAL